MNTLPRRSILRGLAAAPLAPTLPAAAMGQAAEADLTFVLIERHRAAYQALNAIAGDIMGDEPEVAIEDAAMTALVEREPTTLAGLRAFAEYFDAYIKRNDLQAAEWALATIAEACRRLFAEGGAA